MWQTRRLEDILIQPQEAKDNGEDLTYRKGKTEHHSVSCQTPNKPEELGKNISGVKTKRRPSPRNQQTIFQVKEK